MNFKILSYLFCLGLLFSMQSCTDLDIPPKNLLTEDKLFDSKDGVMTYIARMYSIIPMEDYKYSHGVDGLFNLRGAIYVQPSCRTGEAIGRDTRGSEQESATYWDAPYLAIRDVNIFLETLPEYKDFHLESDYETYMAEARFVRATIYYSLVKRYGGVPLVDEVIDYPGTVDAEGTKLFRASEEEIWDFIAEDLDYAIENLPESADRGRATKYAAAGYKSRVMLHAGSIAKYNEVNEVDPATNKRICGVPANRADDYFQAALEASLIVDQSGHELFKGYWHATNKTAQATNFGAIFLVENSEQMFVRLYKYPDAVHEFDNSAQPRQTSSGDNNSEINPTLDFVEMFEGFDKDADGKFENFDPVTGKYKLWNSPLDAFINCEPRLRATVILPMDEFMGQIIDMRRGIWTGPAASGISRLLPQGYVGKYSSEYDEDSYLKLSIRYDFNNANPVALPGGGTMKRSGESGIVSEWDFGGISGFLLRKGLNPEQTENASALSTQPWIELRYAEVLLNRAEAAYELYLSGKTSTGSVNHLAEAYRCINLIRERAGATQLGSAAELNSIDIIRTERRKELAFENKTYWDLKRWRIIFEEQNQRRYRTIAPFYSTDAGKYFIDIIPQESRENNHYIYTYDTKYYYQPIPNAEILKNPNCKQNPGF